MKSNLVKEYLPPLRIVKRSENFTGEEVLIEEGGGRLFLSEKRRVLDGIYQAALVRLKKLEEEDALALADTVAMLGVIAWVHRRLT